MVGQETKTKHSMDIVANLWLLWKRLIALSVLACNIVFDQLTEKQRTSNGGLGHQNDAHCCVGGVETKSQVFHWCMRTPKQWTLLYWRH